MRACGVVDGDCLSGDAGEAFGCVVVVGGGDSFSVCLCEGAFADPGGGAAGSVGVVGADEFAGEVVGVGFFVNEVVLAFDIGVFLLAEGFLTVSVMVDGAGGLSFCEVASMGLGDDGHLEGALGGVALFVEVVGKDSFATHLLIDFAGPLGVVFVISPGVGDVGDSH